MGTIYIVSIESIFFLFSFVTLLFRSFSLPLFFHFIVFVSFELKQTQSHKSNYHKTKYTFRCCCCCSKCLLLPFKFSAPLLFVIKNYENVSAFFVILYLAFHLLLILLRYFVVSSSTTLEPTIFYFFVSIWPPYSFLLLLFGFMFGVFGCCRFYPLLFYYKFRRYIKEWHIAVHSICGLCCIFACYEVNLYYSETV